MPAKKSTARELLFGDLWEFDPAPESAPAHIEPRYGLFVGGKSVAPKSRKYFDSISPRDGKKHFETPALQSGHHIPSRPSPQKQIVSISHA